MIDKRILLTSCAGLASGMLLNPHQALADKQVSYEEAVRSVTNSFDHAFPGGKGGSIVVSVRRVHGEGDIATMTIRDDGTGFLAKAESKRHGLMLVRRPVEQVRGSAVVESGHGTVWTIKIPVERIALAS